jgi:hypothetical protein
MTVLDPRFKNMDFKGSSCKFLYKKLTFIECESYYKYLCLYVVEMRDNAFKWLTTNYNADYAPENDCEELAIVEKGPPPKLRKLASDVFLDDDDDDDEEMGEEEEREVEEAKK